MMTFVQQQELVARSTQKGREESDDRWSLAYTVLERSNRDLTTEILSMRTTMLRERSIISSYESKIKHLNGELALLRVRHSSPTHFHFFIPKPYKSVNVVRLWNSSKLCLSKFTRICKLIFDLLREVCWPPIHPPVEMVEKKFE